MFTEIIEILSLAITAWQQFATGGAKGSADLAATLVALAQKANAAYITQTGKPIDPALLQPIQLIP